MSQHSLVPPGLTRRRLLSGTAGVGGTAALGSLATGCGTPASLTGDGDRVRFWNLFDGGDGANMRAMLDRFRAEHPTVTVDDVTLAWGAPYYTKLAMAGAGGRAPELGVVHLGRLPGFAPGRLLDPIDTGLLAEHGVRREDFNPLLWDAATVNGELYGLPLDIFAFVQFYNRPVCEAAGLLAPDGNLAPLRGERAFLTALDAVREVTGTSPLGWNALQPVECWWAFLSLYTQLDGVLLTPDHTGTALDDDKAETVLAFLARLVAEEYAIPGQDLVGYLVNGGGLVWFGNWLVINFQTADLDFGVTPFPTLLGDTPAGQADSHTLVLPHQDQRGGPAHENAHLLMAWLVRHSIDWAAASHVPAYLPVLQDPDYLAMRPQSEYRAAMDQAAFDPPAWFAGTQSALQNDVGNAISAAAMGFTTPAQGVRAIRAALGKLLATRDPFGGRGAA